ncbi:toprim domain-containing protein [Spirosoma linguale]
MDIEHANTIPIAEILTKLGRKPSHTNNHKHRYLSPLRNEKTASFHLNTKTNRWHDFGEGIGGDTVNFVRAYLKATKEADTTSDALRWINNMAVGHYQIAPGLIEDVPKDPPSLCLKNSQSVQQLGLVHYLAKRGIPLTIARQRLKEVYVCNQNTRKSFYALGFPNEEGGFELRNPFFKGSLGAKSISFIRGTDPKPQGIHLFEGFMDYLSAIVQLKGKGFKEDVIVLNSIACLKQAFSYMHNYGYRVAYTWMDNDPAGEKATAVLSDFIKTQDSMVHTSMNKVYAPHKDVNAWHMHRHNLTL